MPQLEAVYSQVGISNAQDVDFACSGSCGYLQGAAFAFVAGVDALGAYRQFKNLMWKWMQLGPCMKRF